MSADSVNEGKKVSSEIGKSHQLLFLVKKQFVSLEKQFVSTGETRSFLFS